jgi:arginyl-tRNA synthetase
VRCNSILRKSKVESQKSDDLRPSTFDYALDPSEIELIEAISRFPAEVQRAAEETKPLVIASHGYEVARAFASFYDKCPVIQAEENVRAARLELVMAARQTMANALSLLGIQAPEVM